MESQLLSSTPALVAHLALVHLTASSWPAPAVPPAVIIQLLPVCQSLGGKL